MEGLADAGVELVVGQATPEGRFAVRDGLSIQGRAGRIGDHTCGGKFMHQSHLPRQIHVTFLMIFALWVLKKVFIYIS